jgi:hypothetical protein
VKDEQADGDDHTMAEGTPSAFIPCPVCLAPIPIDDPSAELPQQLTCPTCLTVLTR